MSQKNRGQKQRRTERARPHKIAVIGSPEKDKRATR